MSHVLDGRRAHHEGLPRSASPHSGETPEHREWMAGWESAEAESRQNGEQGASFEPMDALRSAGAVRPGGGLPPCEAGLRMSRSGGLARQGRRATHRNLYDA